MYLKNVADMIQLMLRFRNGWSLVRAMRAGQPCNEVVLWDGTRLVHPPGRGGILEALMELWLRQHYTGGFYRPQGGDVIVDAGANVGLFSIFMARKNAECRILAIEPYRENFHCLQANVASAHVENISCHEIALGGSAGRGQMQAVGNRSLDHILQVGDGAKSEVPVVTLRDLLELAHAQEVDFLKVDIEGSENAAFPAASADVLSRFKRIAVEYHDQIAPGTSEMLQNILASTHEVEIYPSGMEGCGIIRAVRRQGVTPSC